MPVKNVHQESLATHHRRFKRGILLCLFLTYLFPIIILSVYFHYKSSAGMLQSSKLQLVAEVEARKNTIDLFMQKRVVNMFNLFHMEGFSLSPTQERMESYLDNLIRSDDAFVDVGLINPLGIQTEYAGPYSNLKGKNYGREEWYIRLINQEKSYIITDLYMGLRQEPHFTVGVRQLVDGEYHVIRASVYPDKLLGLIHAQDSGSQFRGFLVNQKGVFQVGDHGLGNLLEPAYYVPDFNDPAGVVEMDWDGSPVLVAHTWLQEVPWCLVVIQPKDVAFEEMASIRNTMILGTIVLVLVIMVFIWLVVTRLLNRTRDLDQERHELKGQLYHAHKMVSVGQLVGEVAHEINNPLAIIDSESGIIRDMLDPEMGLDASPEAIRKELDQIDKAVMRARAITQEILSFVRKSEPKIEECDLNQLIDDVVSGMKEQEFKVSDILLIKEKEESLPKIQVDPDLMRQVLLNLLNNAGDAVEKGDTITLKTSQDQGYVKVTVSDTGSGMTPDQLEKIFTPFFTTKKAGQGTGLGLPICLNIVQGFGGRIEVQSSPGQGTSFSVFLPVPGKNSLDKDNSGNPS